VYRELFEPMFGPGYVLEHHSAVAPRERLDDRGRDAEDERLRRARLAAENWASPVVVTTSVRFFESLFAHKPSDCRKLHNIARSVVLFDEVQTLPPRLVPSLLSAVGLLTQEPYGITAVFMTATQPAFASAKPALPYGWQPVEISSNPGAMADALCRTCIELPGPDAHLAWPALAARLSAHPQALCVVNTTAHARELFQQLPPENRFHLSADSARHIDRKSSNSSGRGWPTVRLAGLSPLNSSRPAWMSTFPSRSAPSAPSIRLSRPPAAATARAAAWSHAQSLYSDLRTMRHHPARIGQQRH